MSKKTKSTKATKIVRTAAATLKKYRDQGNYSHSDGFSGLSLNNGDTTALSLAMFDPKRVMAIAEAVLPGLAKGELAKRYAKLNPGMQRMNSGNRIRAALKKGTITNAQLKKAMKAA